MHIRNRAILSALAVVAVGIGLAAVPAFATHARTVGEDPVVPSQHSLLIDVFTAKEQVPTPQAGVFNTTMVPARWGVDAGATTTVTVYNFTASAHTIVAPGLNLNVAIKPGKAIGKAFKGETAVERSNGVVPAVTTFTVTAGTTQAAYAWQSTAPQDAGKWGMSGLIVVN